MPATNQSHPLLFRSGVVVTPGQPVAVQDVLVVDGQIASVGKNLRHSGAQIIDCENKIVTVPWVDSHCHGWESPFAYLADGMKFPDYIGQITINYLSKMSAEDIGQAERGSALQALNRGVGTICAWCHAIRTEDDALAALRGAASSKARIVFLHGYNSVDFFTSPGPVFEDVEKTFAEADKLKAKGARIAKVGMGVPGPQFQAMDEFAKQVKFSDAHPDTLLSMHDAPFTSGPTAIGAAAKAGLLRANQLWVHATGAGKAELQQLAQAKAAVSFAPEIDERVFGTPPYQLAVEAGLAPSLSSDDAAIGGGNLRNQVRALITGQQRQAGQEGSLITDDSALATVTISAARALGLTDVGALKKGFRGDVMVIDPANADTPFLPANAIATVLAAEPDAIQMVVLDGHILKRNGKLMGVDLAKEVKKLAEIAERITVA